MAFIYTVLMYSFVHSIHKISNSLDTFFDFLYKTLTSPL